ncbi:hypothetical protein SEPCBS119000_000968 [Sporothrix epigloea]|uniref:Uncharacterized protein n=1 Tax=Sporothrix epigloea TaxID=1892477 RepID=A0ABP0DB95_9PEZI
MIPPVEEAVLLNNPDFAKLYATLTTVILNPDGSTKADAGAKERASLCESAKSARLRAAKDHLLEQAVTATAALPPAEAASAAAAGRAGGAVARRAARSSLRPTLVPPLKPSNDLPPELVDILQLLPPLMQLSAAPSSSPLYSLSAQDFELLLTSPPLDSLPEHLPRLAGLVSENLQASARGLARVANPATNPSYLHRAVPGLPAQAAALQQAVTDARLKLAAARHATATALLRLLDQHAAALSACIRTLETKHGAVARSLELRAAEVALEAQSEAIDANATLAAAQRVVYPPEATAALRNYASHLRDSKRRLDETLRERERLLRDYGVDVEALRADEEGADPPRDRIALGRRQR